MNGLRLSFLVGVPGIILLSLGYVVLEEEGILLGSLLWLLSVTGLHSFSDKIVIKVCRAELLTIYHTPSLFWIVEDVCKKAGMPTPKIYMIPEEPPNICSVGFSGKKAGLLFTEGMLKYVSPNELECAIAHELVHLRRRDTGVGMIITVIACVLGMNSYAMVERASSGDVPAAVGSFRHFGVRTIRALLTLGMALLMRLFQNVRREYRADAMASDLVGRPLDMANAIRTMEKKKHSIPSRVSPAVAHLFLVSPIRSISLMRILKTHPPMEKRIEKLQTLHIPERRLMAGFGS